MTKSAATATCRRAVLLLPICYTSSLALVVSRPGDIDASMKRAIGNDAHAFFAELATNKSWPFGWDLSSIFGSAPQPADSSLGAIVDKDASRAAFETPPLPHWARNWTGPYRQELTNNWEVQYTAKINIGEQEMSTVIDTGSFELLVFSTECKLCNHEGKQLYDRSLSKTYLDLNFSSEHNFGSGTTKSNEAFEYVQVGPFAAKSQHFWEVVDADMPILKDGFFHAVLGVGPPRSAAKFAKINADEIHRELDQYTEQHGDVPKDVMDEVHRYDEAVEHAYAASSLMESLRMKQVSVCLGRKSQSPGYFVWDDDASWREKTKFAEFKVAGDIYWSLNFSDVKLTKQHDFVLDDHVDAWPTACNGDDDVSRCSAVLDTGTSLIIAPTAFVNAVQEALDKWDDPTGDCSDISGLPELEFKLNGVQFSLPPSSYIGKVSGDGNGAPDSMPHLAKGGSKRSPNRCMALLMAADTNSQFGQLWVLGMPFFRKFYTSFLLRYENIAGESPAEASANPDTIKISVADDDCKPSAKPFSSMVESSLRQQRTLRPLLEPKTIKASSLSTPRFVHTLAASSQLGGGEGVGSAATSLRLTPLSPARPAMPPYVHI